MKKKKKKKKESDRYRYIVMNIIFNIELLEKILILTVKN